MSPYEPPKRRAVALKYQEEEGTPVVVASGLGYMAEKIVELANENNVPVFEDSSLSTVLSQLELGAAIPEELYKAVVDIYVYFLNFVPGQGIRPDRSTGSTGNKPVMEVRKHQDESSL